MHATPPPATAACSSAPPTLFTWGSHLIYILDGQGGGGLCFSISFEEVSEKGLDSDGLNSGPATHMLCS